jgi:hypothetical protein
MEVCPRPTGTTSLSRLTIIESRFRAHPIPGMDIRVLRVTVTRSCGGPMSRSTRDVSRGMAHEWRPLFARFGQIRGWGVRATGKSQRLGRIVRSQSRVLSAATWRSLAAYEGRP